MNNVELYFDVEGSSLSVDGGSMRSKPTLLLIHGGPGVDHTIYKPHFGQLADIAQVVYLDLRGNGRSDHGPIEDWTLAQWGDDIRDFCNTLGIEAPIVYGASWGGTVAISYATRHPEHASKLILVSTEAKAYTHLEERVEKFTRLGGPTVGELARRRFIEGDTSPEMLEKWLQSVFPFYTHPPFDPQLMQRATRNPEVTAWFTREGGEGREFDMLADLGKVNIPTLIVGGGDDPMVPITCQIDIMRAMPNGVARLETVANAGHGVIRDAPDFTFQLIREFIDKIGRP